MRDITLGERPVIQRWLILYFLIVAGSVHAHRGSDLVPIQLVTSQWATAAQSEDSAAMAPLLTDDFTYLGRPKPAYFATMEMVQLRKISFQYATYQIDGSAATVSPVLYVPYREMYNAFAWTLKLEKLGDEWRVSAVEPAQLPEEYNPPDHPHHHILHNVRVTITDETSGEPIFARVHVRDAAGDYWPPQGHRKRVARGWRADIGGAVVVGGKTFAYVTPEFLVPLPLGKYVLETRRGIEYKPLEVEFEVTGDDLQLDLKLSRWTHMAAKGWYSGDTHTHFLDPHFGMLEAQGEDLNILHSLASSGGNLSTQLAHFTGAPSVLSTEENIFYMSEETRHDYLGHTVLLGLKKFIYPFGWGPPLTGVHGGYDFPTMAHQADQAHANGAVVAWSHLPHPHAELPIDVALGKIDAVEAFVFGNPFKNHPVRIDMGELTPEAMSPIQLWYALLNTGSNMPGLGGTDKMWNTQVVGAVRTYVQVDGKLTYDKWLDGVKQGRNFVSTGAMIEFNLDDTNLGDVRQVDEPTRLPFTARAESHLPIKRLEVVVNGEVVALVTSDNGAQILELVGEVAIDKSSWVAARAYNDSPLPTQGELTGSGSLVLAHTGPVYVDVNGQPRSNPDDAAFLHRICAKTIQWAESAALYQSQAQRQAVIDLYRKGCDVYRVQAGL